MGISGTTGKSRKRKFVPSSHLGPFAVVESSRKSQTKVGTLACFDFFVSEWVNYVKTRQCYSMLIWFTLLNRPNAMMKKALLWVENRTQIEHITGFLQFYVKTKKVCRCFASFSSEQEHFTCGMYMTALTRSWNVKKIEPIMFFERINTKVFRRSIAFAIALVVTSRSSTSDAHPWISSRGNT